MTYTMDSDDLSGRADAEASRIRSFRIIAKELAELNSLAGRISMETGQFWRSAGIIDRSSSVNEQLLADLSRLQADLLEEGLREDHALALIGRSIFCQYLVDRQIVNQHRLSEICGKATLAEALRNSVATEQIFGWLREKFNGDMFPQTDGAGSLDSRYLNRVADFLDAVDPDSGQTTLFPYQFDIIPVELISSIYEHFASPSKNSRLSGAEREAAKAKGIHYTPLPLASFILDEVLDDLTGHETVLDLTCGSGVFLVEALRRLVRLRSHGRPCTRDSIRSTLYGQLYGVDISEAAIRVAAFSLYLAALELDPDPRPLEALRFEPLIGRTLHVADALQIESIRIRRMQGSPAAASQPFDVIVGNPPWTFGGKASTVQLRSKLDGNAALSPRNPSLAFVQRSMAFAGPETRFGLVLSANPFFGVSKTGQDAALDVVRKLSPVTIVNLANHSDWLFREVTMPAVAVFGRHRPDPHDRITVVQVPWSPAGRRSHTFEISASDVVRLPRSAWKRQPALLKAAFCGKRRDLVLLDRLAQRFDTLGDQLQRIGSKLSGGMTLGDGSGGREFRAWSSAARREGSSSVQSAYRSSAVQQVRGRAPARPRPLPSACAARQGIRKAERPTCFGGGRAGRGLYELPLRGGAPASEAQFSRTSRGDLELGVCVVVYLDELLDVRPMDATGPEERCRSRTVPKSR